MTRAFPTGGLRARRAGWGIADQALSSLTNFALGIVVARSTTPEGFGAFGLAFATYLLFLNASRALASEPLVVRYSARSEQDWLRGSAAATGMAATVGVVGGIACVIVGLLADEQIGGPFIALGLTLPGLLVQDAWRFAFFAARRGRDAFANDAVWTVALVPLLVLAATTSSGASSVGAYVLAWGLAGGAGALFGILQARVVPRPTRVRAWLREHRVIAPRYLAEFMTQSGAVQLAAWAIGIVAGLATLGIIRAAQLLLGATHIATYGVQIASVPEAARVARVNPGHLVRLCATVGAGLAALAIALGLLLLALPPAVGFQLLGELWLPVRTILVPQTITTAAAGLMAGATVGLRGLAAARRSLRARLVTSSLIFVLSVGGAAVGGALGASWGSATALTIGALVWWWQLRRAIGEGLQPADDRPSHAAGRAPATDPAQGEV